MRISELPMVTSYSCSLYYFMGDRDMHKSLSSTSSPQGNTSITASYTHIFGTTSFSSCRRVDASHSNGMAYASVANSGARWRSHGSRTSCSTVQRLVLWQVAQGAECMPQKKQLSGFWWPNIIDMEMDNYVDVLLLFFWKKTRCHVLLYELSNLHTLKLLLAPTLRLCNFNGCRRACSEVCPLCKMCEVLSVFCIFIWQRLHVVLWSFIDVLSLHF
ncbi:hypothetical protein VPH35_029262 [Triticum aestivum]